MSTLNDNSERPLIGITMGDPAGIGPELCLCAIREPAVLDCCVPIVFGDISLLRRVARACRWPAPPEAIPLAEWEEYGAIDAPRVIHCEAIDAETVRPGQVQNICGKAVYTYIKAAARAALNGRISGIATAPIHKEALREAGIVFPGHTEMLAEITGAKQFCMMMASEKITVSLATIHVGYAEVPRALTTQQILHVIELTADALRHLGHPSPRIAVCGLNPHAGEHGLFGDEEEKIIEPAIAEAQLNGLEVQGPFPPDSAFTPGRMSVVDAYVVMYHDQGLIPFKMLAFDRGVNITLGLPIVRTSVDHGTAFDIAWQGKASPTSMIQSILWAVRLAGY